MGSLLAARLLTGAIRTPVFQTLSLFVPAAALSNTLYPKPFRSERVALWEPDTFLLDGMRCALLHSTPDEGPSMRVGTSAVLTLEPDYAFPGGSVKDRESRVQSVWTRGGSPGPTVYGLGSIFI